MQHEKGLISISAKVYVSIAQNKRINTNIKIFKYCIAERVPPIIAQNTSLHVLPGFILSDPADRSLRLFPRLLHVILGAGLNRLQLLP